MKRKKMDQASTHMQRLVEWELDLPFFGIYPVYPLYSMAY